MRVAKLLILAVVPFYLSAQGIEGNDRKSLKFLIGTEYRITPIYNYNVSSFSEQSIFTNRDIQNSGIALNLGLEYEIARNFGIGFSNSFRYDMVIASRPAGENEINVGSTDYKLIVDYHLYVAYYYRAFSKGDIFVNAGMSLLNTNTNFSVKTIDEFGQGFYISDFSFFANRISIGFQSAKSRFYFGANISRTTEYFAATTTFIIPHIGFTYSLAKL